MPIVNLRDSINKCNTVFCLSLSVIELEKAKNSLEGVLGDKDLLPNLRENGEALLFRLSLKILALKYFNEGFTEEDYNLLIDYVKNNYSIAEGKGYGKTCQLLKAVEGLAIKVHEVMLGAIELVYGVHDFDGNLTTTDLAKLDEFTREFNKKREMALSLEDTPALFGVQVKMIDVKATVVSAIDNELAWAKSNSNKLKLNISETFIEDCTESLDDAIGPKQFTYFPSMPEDSRINAKTIVLLSPLYDEIFLYVRAYAEKHKLNFVILNSGVFNGKDDKYVQSVFEMLADKGKSVVITGLNRYHDNNKNKLYENIIRYSKKGFTAFCIDDVGTRSVYDEAYEVAKTAESLTGLDVAYKYLTMPDYDGVIKEIEEKGMTTPADRAYVQKNMAFMGFVGLNLAVSLFNANKDWKQAVIDLSKEHEVVSNAYVKNIPSQIQFIDIAWVDLAIKAKEDKNQREFDYDSIRSVNVENVKKILELNESIMVKCGLITKYCCLAGEDSSIWQSLPIEEQEKRVNDATRLVCHLLCTENVPFVDIVPEKEWTEKSAGGFCCDGGKRIIYREDCVQDYAWLIDAICHESYHSFQHTLVGQGWRKWHLDELGVCSHRVYEWGYNFARYKDIGKSRDAYMIQIVEADTRIFAKNCITLSENKWHLLNLE